MTDKYDLFEHCKKGNAKAQGILYDLFKGKLMGLCRRYTRNREEAQDILQETFVRIFTKIHQLESRDKFESWMKAIAVRTAITHYHRTKTHNLVFIQPFFKHILSSGEAFNEPFQVRPYRAGVSIGTLYQSR